MLKLSKISHQAFGVAGEYAPGFDQTFSCDHFLIDSDKLIIDLQTTDKVFSKIVHLFRTEIK